jgi:hypothetical protein
MNPYSTYARRDDEVYDRQALIDALEEPPMTARPRTPARTPQQTREMLEGPGGRTTVTPETDTGGNDYSGPVDDALPDPRSRPPAGASTPFNRGRGYELLDDYDEGYDRRLEGSPSVAGNAAKYGMAAGNVVPGWGHAIGAIGGAVGAAFAKNAKSAMTDFSTEDARAIIGRAHKDALGRDITPEYLDQIMRGQGWKEGDKWFGEGPLAYVLDQFGTHAEAEAGQRAENPAAGAAAPPSAPGGAQAGTMGGGLPFSGFDFSREQDTSKSAKDAFAALAQQAPPMTDTSKAGAEAWFRQHIAPGMEAAGFKVYDLQGDKAWIGSREDPEGNVPVDWLINAGGSNVQIGWQPDGGGGGIAGGAGNAQDAYQQLVGSISPNASKEEMESAIAAAFGHLPGYGGAYKESVMLNGQWYDLVRGYGGAGAEFQGLTPKDDHGAGAGISSAGPSNTGLNLAPGVSLAAPLGNSDVYAQIQAALQRLMSGASTRDELLQALGG